MKTIEQMGAQGDVLFRRIGKVPSGFKETTRKCARLVVAHSETGHHHAIDDLGVKLFEGDDPLRCYLMLENVDHADVVHHRPFDTHETMRLLGSPGAVFEVIR